VGTWLLITDVATTVTDSFTVWPPLVTTVTDFLVVGADVGTVTTVVKT
jgi:hypothetical protein